jgi:hypothetical protein
VEDIECDKLRVERAAQESIRRRDELDRVERRLKLNLKTTPFDKLRVERVAQESIRRRDELKNLLAELDQVEMRLKLNLKTTPVEK